MSINSSLLAGVSGLVANSSALAAISDNIVNVNTVGYKRSQIDFTNIVTSQSVQGRYAAGGVQAATRQFVNQQGLVQSSASATDMAVSGEGFFVVTDKSTGLAPGDARMFTRAGSFHVDQDGFLINDANFYLQGWPIAPDGTIDINPSDLSSLTSINVRNLGASVSQTTDITVNANLGADTPTSAAITGGTYAAGDMQAYADDPTAAGAVKPDFTIEVSVIDSLGGSHTIAMSFLKGDPDPAEDGPGVWYAEVYAVPIDDIEGGDLISSGNAVFDADGVLDLAASDFLGSAGATSIDIGESDGGTAPAWAEMLGVRGQTLNFNLAAANGGLKQLHDSSTVNSIAANGASVGNVVSVEVSERGIVSAVFDNGEVRNLAQVALATFPNPDGLQSVSGNAYRVTINSGDFSLKVPGDGGAGMISPSSLEASTVDLSAEFTSLIVTQRAYSASSKIITTADQMMEELLSIKR